MTTIMVMKTIQYDICENLAGINSIGHYLHPALKGRHLQRIIIKIIKIVKIIKIMTVMMMMMRMTWKRAR